jgi:hypothetical protein
VDQPVTLIPMLCVRCSTPLPARPGEVAWVCPQCQRGQMLHKNDALVPIDFNFHANIPAGAAGKPYWIVGGLARLSRQAYSGNKQEEALRFWSTPRNFYIPAYLCPLETLIELGPRMLQNPVPLLNGPLARFEPVTVAQADLVPLAEFIVMGIEAARQDKLKSLSVSLELGSPALWILPG